MGERERIRSAVFDHLAVHGPTSAPDLAGVVGVALAEVASLLNRDSAFKRVGTDRGVAWDLEPLTVPKRDIADARARAAGVKEMPCYGLDAPRPPKASSGGRTVESTGPGARAAPVGSAGRSSGGAPFAPTTRSSPPARTTRAATTSPSPSTSAAAATSAIIADKWPLPDVDGPLLQIVDVSPAIAASMLARSTWNRKERKGHVAWLAEQITACAWKLTHQSIAFSAGGRLLDGHHRLRAIIIAGKTVPMAVTTGWDDATWESIDCGVVRLPKDRLTLTEPATRNARAIMMVSAILRCEGSHGKALNRAITDGWAMYRAGFEMTERCLPAMIPGITRRQVVAALIKYHSRHPDHAPRFAEQLRTGEGGEHEPAIALRNHLLRHGWLGETQTYWTAVAAMNAHRRGEDLTTIIPASAWD